MESVVDAIDFAKFLFELWRKSWLWSHARGDPSPEDGLQFRASPSSGSSRVVPEVCSLLVASVGTRSAQRVH